MIQPRVFIKIDKLSLLAFLLPEFTANRGGLKMAFWKKKSDSGEEKLSGPKVLPGIVQQYLIKEMKVEADFAPLLKSVARKNGTTGFLIRIYDESDVMARKIEVKNFLSLDDKPEAIIYDGSYDEATKKVELVEKKKLFWTTPIYTEAEIKQKIEALTQPGSTVFFYQARGGQNGGPLGKGAIIIELNPAPEKGKKYNVNVVDVIDLQPIDKGTKMFATNKAKDAANWIAQLHQRRLYS
jgi:hypothetical protein